MAKAYWRKARASKYKHLYRENKAICGSVARPYPWGSAENIMSAQKCPKCLNWREEGNAHSFEE